MAWHQRGHGRLVVGLNMMKNNAPAYRQQRTKAMYVGKLRLQQVLKRRMHGRRGSVFLRPAGAEIIVEHENVENTR